MHVQLESIAIALAAMCKPSACRNLIIVVSKMWKAALFGFKMALNKVWLSSSILKRVYSIAYAFGQNRACLHDVSNHCIKNCNDYTHVELLVSLGQAILECHKSIKMFPEFMSEVPDQVFSVSLHLDMKIQNYF